MWLTQNILLSLNDRIVNKHILQVGSPKDQTDIIEKKLTRQLVQSYRSDFRISKYVDEN